MSDGSAIHIVVVESNSNLAAYYVNTLTSLGYQVTLLERGEEIIDYTFEHRTDFLILDLETPGLSGFDTLDILHHSLQTATLPIIALSSLVTPNDRRRAHDLGVRGLFVASIAAAARIIQDVEKYFHRATQLERL